MEVELYLHYHLTFVLKTSSDILFLLWFNHGLTIFFTYSQMQWEKKCKLLKSEAAGGGSHGSLIGPLNDIHNESKSEYVNSFDKNKLDRLTSDVKCSNSVVTLQDYTIERSQISHSKICTVGPQMLHAGTGVGLGARTPNGLPGFWFSSFFQFQSGKELVV